jgi:hypothetical protein
VNEFPVLQKESIKKWLNGVEPVWPLLGFANIRTLLLPHPFTNGEVKIHEGKINDEIKQSKAMRGVSLFLKRLIESSGVKLTTTGNLNRKFVAEMVDQFNWEGYTAEEVYRFSKVINELDFPPLHYIHVLTKESRLVRKYKGNLIVAKEGKALSSPDQAGALFAKLFSATFEILNASYFDRLPHDGWPEAHIAVILCCLGMVGHEWQTADVLVRKTTLPDEGFINSEWDYTASAYYARVLRFLEWFGLIEQRKVFNSEKNIDEKEFRIKQVLKNVFSFDIKFAIDDGLLQ